eukprot:6928981-Prymnesium_polylepis.1
MNEALSAAPSRYTVASYSLDGHKRILEGDVPADILDATEGVVKLHSALADDQTKADLASVTSRRSSSVFGDTYGGLLQSALRFSDVSLPPQVSTRPTERPRPRCATLPRTLLFPTLLSAAAHVAWCGRRGAWSGVPPAVACVVTRARSRARVHASIPRVCPRVCPRVLGVRACVCVSTWAASSTKSSLR